MKDDFNYDNEIIEIGVEETNEIPIVKFSDDGSVIEEKVKEKQPKKDNIFKRMKKWFKDLPKKKKIIIIVTFSVILLLLIGCLVYFIFIKKEDVVKKDVIVISDNYKYKNGDLIFLDDKKEIGNYTCKNKDVKKCYVAYLDNDTDTFDHESSLDSKGKLLKERSKIYLNKYVFVFDDGKINLYNIKSKKIEERLESIKAYKTKRDLVVFESKDSKFGVLEFKENNYEKIINAYYDYLGIIDTDKLLLLSTTDKKERIISIDNKNLSKEFSINIKSASSTHIAAQSGKSYNLYSYNFEELLSNYDYISFHGDIISLVKDKKLYFVDNDLNKLNEVGLELKNDNYNIVNKYDKKKKLESSNASYKVTVNEGNVSVLFNDTDTKVINIYEGKVNKNYSYFSYFDGILYFYGDSDKTDLIGTYNCVNKNKIVSENDGLDTCSLYASDKGVTGIYNNNFVFISDNIKIMENKVITLYSIKEKKNKASYLSIDIVNKGNVGNNVMPYYTEGLFVIAKSASKGNYGVIKLDSANATNLVSFNYKSIALSNGYYLLQNVDGKYSLWDLTFNKISDELDYIETLNKYYVGIKDKKLNVYRYDTTTSKVLNTDVILNSTDYKNAYKITIGNYIIVTVDGKDYKYDAISGKLVVDNVAPVVGGN